MKRDRRFLRQHPVMVNHLSTTILLSVLLLLPATTRAEEKLVTLASFLEAIPAQNDQLKDIINSSFESVGYPRVSGHPRETVDHLTLLEYRFDAFQKGRITRDPAFTVYLDVAQTMYGADGAPYVPGQGYPASSRQKLIGYRVVAHPTGESPATSDKTEPADKKPTTP